MNTMESSFLHPPQDIIPEWFAGCRITPEGVVLLPDGTPTNTRYNPSNGLFSYPVGYPGIEFSLDYPVYEQDHDTWYAWQWVRNEIRNNIVVKWHVESQPAPTIVAADPSPTPNAIPVQAVPAQKKKWEGGIKLRYKEVPTAYIDVRSGEGIIGDHILKTSGKNPTLMQIIEVLPVECRRVYLVGPKPGRDTESLYAWFRDRQVGSQWRVKKFLQDDDLPLLDLVARDLDEESGTKKPRTLRVQRMAQWFDDDIDYTPAQAQQAMALLDSLLQENFDEHARCLNTPGATGLALWDRNRHSTYPKLEPDLQRLIRATSGQGRFELCTFPDRPMLKRFVYKDGRFMYGALGTGLGFGPGELDSISEFEPNRRGRYLVHFQVPRNWDHVGLLPVKDDDGETWVYPSEPRFDGETWADAVEVRLALSQGWHIKIKERLLLQSSSKDHPWPLDTWVKRLITMRTDVETRAKRGEVSRLLAELVMQALRGIVLHAVGGFHRSDSFETVIVYDSQELRQVPARFQVQSHNDGTWTYKRPAPLDPWSQQFQHPEFSSAIWARCRSRLLLTETKKKGVVVERSGVLTLPRKSLVGMRVDAMYLEENPAWPDDGQPGRFRLKGLLDEPCPQPNNYEELNALRDRSVLALRQH